MFNKFTAIFALVLFFHASSFAASKNSQNCDKLLSVITIDSSPLTLGAIDYSKITPKVFHAAIKDALVKAYQNLDAIKNNKNAPDYKNTIEALQYVSADLDLVWGIFYETLGLLKTDKLDAIYDKFAKQRVKFGNKLSFDEDIFKRIEAVYNQKSSLNLNPIQLRLLEKTYEAYIESGINLPKDQKDRISAINTRLVALSKLFNDKVLAETKAFQVVITDQKDLAGLPELAIKSAAETAQSRGKPGAWIFTFDEYASIDAYSENRDLRKQFWEFYATRASKGPNDNRPVLLEIAKLRQEKAQILGHKTYADLVLKDRMAKNVDTVKKFISHLISYYRPQAKKELDELTAFAGMKLEPWDIGFYSQKLRQKKYNFDEEALKPYFQYEQVLASAIYSAEKLYNIKFKQRKDLPVWHPDVLAYEVVDSNANQLALFYIDPFPRKGTKLGGAHMNTLRPAGIFNGKMLRPHVINVSNIEKPVGDTPSLLTLRNARTIFHELGHGLHEMLTQVEVPSFAGTSVPWDAVELPSQLNEKWQLSNEVLNKFARHYQTKEPLPQSVIDQILASENFMVGTFGLGQMTLGSIDLAWYTQDISHVQTPDDVNAHENEALKDVAIMPRYNSVRSASFSHIFSGGYAAGYYSYQWANVLVADAYEYLMQDASDSGFPRPALAKKFLDEVLSQGGSQDFDVLYRNFRGQDPDPDALLRSLGLLPPKGSKPKIVAD